MKNVYCDYCKKKFNDIPESKASDDFPYPGPENGTYQFSVSVKVHLCTGMDICCTCAEKAVRGALDSKELKEKLVKLIVDPPCYYV